MNLPKEEFILDFKDNSIDAKTLANTILEHRNVSKYLDLISHEIDNLNEQIQGHIITKHEDLMTHAMGIEKLEGVLEMMCSRTTNLKVHTDKIKAKLAEPYKNLSTRIFQLDNMQVTCDLLRKITRINCLIQRLEDQKKDPCKASASISELRYHFSNTDWKDISILEKHFEFTNVTANNLVDEAWNILKMLNETNNQGLLGIALQTFRNLDILTVSINEMISNWQNEFTESIKICLDIKYIFQTMSPKSGIVKGPGKAVIPTASQAALFRASFWTMVDKLVNTIESNMTNIFLLTKSLSKKRDMSSQKSLLECLLLSDENDELNEFCLSLFIDGTSNTGYRYQAWMSEKLKEAFHDALLSDKSGFLKQTLENEYPKLLKLFSDMNVKLLSFNASIQRDDLHHGYFESDVKLHQRYFKTFLIEYEQSFLSKSLSKLFDTVEFAFDNDEKMATESDMINFVKILSSEITVASGESHLLSQMIKNAGKMMDLIYTKFEHYLATDSESSQIIGPLTSSQKCNFKIINLLNKFKSNIEQVLFRQLRLSESNQTFIVEKLDNCQKLEIVAIQALLNNISTSIEEIISTVHSENYQLMNKETDCSLMIRELQSFVSRVRLQYLGEIDDENLLYFFTQPIVNHSAEIFLIHLCLIRPMNDFGKQKVLRDLDQFDIAMSPFCLKNQTMSNVLEPNIYRKLRSMRSLLFQSTNTIIENYLSSEKQASSVLPTSYVMNHLFSRAPSELKSPHDSAGRSLQYYVSWIRDHPADNDRLHYIRGTLEAYANTVRIMGKKQYTEMYVQMMTILDNVHTK